MSGIITYTQPGELAPVGIPAAAGQAADQVAAANVFEEYTSRKAKNTIRRHQIGRASCRERVCQYV
jgi:hypothetical protein